MSISAHTVNSGILDSHLKKLYRNEEPRTHRERWARIIQNHSGRTGNSSPRLFSAPGRTELAGNHTDHNQGCVLAAGIHLDTIAAVSPADGYAEVVSEGYPPVKISLDDLNKVPAEEGRTESLVRGIAAAIVSRGGRISGFSATTTSRVLKGSGLSSSAALEILVASIFNELYNEGRFTPVELAIMSQQAENDYFGKPCGLMDQTACSVGGVTAIDFNDPANPRVEMLEDCFHSEGYTLMVVDSGGDHADLTPDYAAIPKEMKAVAAYLGRQVLRETDEPDFTRRIGEIRKHTGDRAVLRAMHFYAENRRVTAMQDALKLGDMDRYLCEVRESGNSSWCLLQNVFSPQHPAEQSVTLALALAQSFLGSEGAVRVHGGGFAGTVQAYIPRSRADEFAAFMQQFFGDGSAVPLSVRSLPAGELLVS